MNWFDKNYIVLDKYSPWQARVGAGSPEGGRWTRAGGATPPSDEDIRFPENRLQWYVPDEHPLSKYKDDILRAFGVFADDPDHTGKLNVTGRIGDKSLRLRYKSANAEVLRDLYARDKSAYHASFYLNDQFRDLGIGKQFLSDSMRLYEKMAIKKVDLDTAGVGSYAWAKYGFVPNQGSWDRYRNGLDISLSRGDVDRILLDKLTLDERKFLRSAIRQKDPKAIWGISDLSRKTKSGNTIGKALLMDNGWSGKLDMKDKEAMARFNTYTGRTKKYSPDQEREPAGTPEGGRFASEGGSSAKPIKSRINDAIDQAYKELFTNPLNDAEVGFANKEQTAVVMMQLDNYTDSLYVKWMAAYPQKSGMGTRGMDYLKGVARTHNVPLTLTPWRHGELGAKKLTRIFKKWGFKPGKQGLLWWHPDVAKKSADADTLYVHRRLINPQSLLDWAKARGFNTTLATDDLHVTVCFSKEPLQWPEPSSKAVVECTGGKRELAQFGEAIVLIFESPELQKEHQDFMDAGASFDFDQYRPHVTLTYDPDLDIAGIEPYDGPLKFGQQVFAPVEEDWDDNIKEQAVKYSPDQPRAPAGTPEGGRWVGRNPLSRVRAVPGKTRPAFGGRESGVIADKGKAGGEAMREYVNMMAQLGNPIAALMRDHGQVYEIDDETFIGGRPQMCYSNTVQATVFEEFRPEQKDLTYVEGYMAVHGVPIHHAFAVTKDGKVRDYTIKKKDNSIIGGYFGMPIKKSFVRKSMMKTKVYGVTTYTNHELLTTTDPKDIVQD